MEPVTDNMTRGMRQVEARLGRPLQDYLREAYEVRRLSMVRIGSELGVDKATVSRWMAVIGIEPRHVGYEGPRTRRQVA